MLDIWNEQLTRHISFAECVCEYCTQQFIPHLNSFENRTHNLTQLNIGRVGFATLEGLGIEA